MEASCATRCSPTPRRRRSSSDTTSVPAGSHLRTVDSWDETNRVVLAAAAGLRSVGHKTFVRPNTRDFDSPVLGVLAEALRLANSRHDRVVLRRICREWERLTGVVIEPHAVGAAAVLAGGDFLRAWVDVADGVAGDARKVLQRIRTDLVDRLDFSERSVDWVLDEGWWSMGTCATPSC